MELIEEKTPTGQASLEFASLNGNDAVFYRLMGAFTLTVPTTGGVISLQFNGDTTAGNYNCTARAKGDNDGSLYDSEYHNPSANGIEIGRDISNRDVTVMFDFLICAKSGARRYVLGWAAVAVPSDPEDTLGLRAGGYWANTVDNLTSLKLIAPGDATFSAGSIVLLKEKIES